jgi:hypothetical protein
VLLEAIQTRYRFLKMPDLQQLFSDKTLLFEHGRFNDYEIRRVVVGEGLFSCDIHGSTDISQALADDIENWLINDLGYERKTDGIAAQVFGSEIEFTLPEGIGGKLARLAALSGKVSELIRSYGNQGGDYGVERISFNADPGDTPHFLRTHPFAIERRVGVPYSFSLWYSVAPLKTADHISTLEEFAELVS